MNLSIKLVFNFNETFQPMNVFTTNCFWVKPISLFYSECSPVAISSHKHKPYSINIEHLSIVVEKYLKRSYLKTKSACVIKMKHVRANYTNQ